MDLQNKKVLITGAANGIGFSLAKKLHQEGALVGILDLDDKNFPSYSKEFGFYCQKCDLTNHEEVKIAVDLFYEKFQEIDILVNNAGLFYSAPLIGVQANGLVSHDLKSWDKVITTNLHSVFYVSRNAVEKMVLKRSKGLVINVSSISASGNPGQSAYSAAKAAVNALTKTWAKELGPWGIRVAGIAPGFVSTPAMKSALAESTLQDIIQRVPVKRLGTVEEILKGIKAIIENDFFHGKILELDGGLVV